MTISQTYNTYKRLNIPIKYLNNLDMSTIYNSLTEQEIILNDFNVNINNNTGAVNINSLKVIKVQLTVIAKYNMSLNAISNNKITRII